VNGSSFAGLRNGIAACFFVSFLAACSGGGGLSPSSTAGGPATDNAVAAVHGISISASRSRLASIFRAESSGRARAMGESMHPSNETTADPPVPVPNEAPCTVQLYSDFQFTNFTYPTFQYTPPANCPGPWAKVVLNASFAVTQGIQFDRTGSIWIDGTNVYFGTTAEPAPGYAPSWNVQKDVTDLTPIFEVPSTGEVVLGNIVNSTYTGVISSSASLSFYPANASYPVAKVPDNVYPLSGGPLGDNQYISTPSQPLTTTVTLPTNVEAAYLDVYLQAQIDDEFWYTCFPDDLAAEIPNCPNTAFREGDVAIDGQAAGVVPVYPWVFTGGLDPYLWTPIPGLETLNFKAYRVNLTPFAALLSNGQPHTINVTVFNNGNYYATNAALLVYLDHGSTQVTGGIISNTTQLEPSPVVVENVPINGSGVGIGTVSVTSSHQVSIDGYVNTSAGRVETKINQTVLFSNVQQVDGNESGTLFDQKIKQDTKVFSQTLTLAGSTTTTASEQKNWPLNVTYDFAVSPSGQTATQYASVAQGRTETGLISSNSALVSPASWTTTNSVNATDTLFYTEFGATPKAPRTTQTESVQAPGQCWNKAVAAQNGLVTLNVGGPC
jgi:hypothetical protein